MNIGDNITLTPHNAWVRNSQGALVSINEPTQGTVTQIDDDGYARIDTPIGVCLVPIPPQQNLFAAVGRYVEMTAPNNDPHLAELVAAFNAADPPRDLPVPSVLPGEATWLTREELWARRAEDDNVEDAGIRFRDIVFTLFDGKVSWQQDDGKRPTCFDPDQIVCMTALARCVPEKAPSHELHGRLLANRGMGPVPFTEVTVPLDDVVQWGKGRVLGNRTGWCVARMRDGRQVWCRVTGQAPAVQDILKNGPGKLKTPPSPNSGITRIAWSK